MHNIRVIMTMQHWKQWSLIVCWRWQLTMIFQYRSPSSLTTQLLHQLLQRGHNVGALSLFLSLNKNQAKVDGLGSEQSVAFGWHSQWKWIILWLESFGTKLKLTNGRREGSIAKGARKSDEGYGKRCGGLAFHHELVADAAVHHVNRVVLAVVDTSPHRPLVSVRWEPWCLVVQLWNEVVRPVWTQLDIWHSVAPHSNNNTHTSYTDRNCDDRPPWQVPTTHKLLKLTDCSSKTVRKCKSCKYSD